MDKNQIYWGYLAYQLGQRTNIMIKKGNFSLKIKIERPLTEQDHCWFFWPGHLEHCVLDANSRSGLGMIFNPLTTREEVMLPCVGSIFGACVITSLVEERGIEKNIVKRLLLVYRFYC